MSLTTPLSVQKLQTALHDKAKGSPNFRFYALYDKVYKQKNLAMAWEKVKENRGSGGIDGQSLEAFEAQLNQQLERLHRELKEDTYQPLPVRQHPIPKRDKPGEYRMLGIPTVIS